MCVARRPGAGAYQNDTALVYFACPQLSISAGRTNFKWIRCTGCTKRRANFRAIRALTNSAAARIIGLNENGEVLEMPKQNKVLNALERFSQALLVPLAYFPAAGLLLVLGALLTSSALQNVCPVLNWPPVHLVGQLLYQCLMVVIDNLGVLFCAGIAAALARQEKQQAVLIALMSELMCLTAGHVTLSELGLLAQPDAVTGLYGTGQAVVLGIQTMDLGAFGGILLGLCTGWVYNRTCEKEFHGVLSQLCSGTRWAFVCMVGVSALLGAGSCFFWPPVQRAISALTGIIAASGNLGLFLYGFLERLLIPTGLHHLVYTPFQFTALGGSLIVGSSTCSGAYAVMMTEYAMDLPFSEGIVWMYPGFVKTFGYFGIAAAFIFCARKENRRKTAAALVPLAITASLASITEAIDFLFCFSAPVLWVAHAVLAGAFIVLLRVCHVTAFTSNLLGSLLMNLSAGAERTHYPVLYLLALCEIAVYFLVFTVLIKALDLPTPGRAAEPEAVGADPLQYDAVEQIVNGLGGAENILSADHCFTRLRVTLKDPALLDETALAVVPHRGIVKQGNRVQIVYGLEAQAICRAVQERLEAAVC